MPGSPCDNACAESFFRSLKVECVDPTHFATRRQAAEETAEYMMFYNRRTIHASLDYRTPVDPSISYELGFCVLMILFPRHTLRYPENRERINFPRQAYALHGVAPRY